MDFRNSCLLRGLVACVGSMIVGPLSAQTFKTLHQFNASDGGHTYSGLILSSNTLYGTTVSTVFALNTDGTGFRTLARLNGGTNGDAVFGGLVSSGNTLYGTASDGGSGGYGTLFAVNTDGTGFMTLYGFSDWDGSGPNSDLVLSGSTLYGVTPGGGDLGNVGGTGSGTMFSINTDGSDFISLYIFSGGNDGVGPVGGLVLSSNILFGATAGGGTFVNGSTYGDGTVFAINTDGTGFADLYSFTAPSTNSSGVYTNSDGKNPSARLLLSDGTLYGVTSAGGIGGRGTIFRLQADGSGFTNLHNFPELPSSGPSTNSGGAFPIARLSISGGTLYGTTKLGGIFGNGTVFAINTDGTGFTNLHSFKGGVDGAAPWSGGLLLSGNTLYGTTYGSGVDYGTIFSISFEPRLSILSSGPNLILSWPTNYAGFDYSGYILQSTTNLSSPVWTTNLQAPTLVNRQYTVTNAISGTQQFYRLSL